MSCGPCGGENTNHKRSAVCFWAVRGKFTTDAGALRHHPSRAGERSEQGPICAPSGFATSTRLFLLTRLHADTTLHAREPDHAKPPEVPKVQQRTRIGASRQSGGPGKTDAAAPSRRRGAPERAPPTKAKTSLQEKTLTTTPGRLACAGHCRLWSLSVVKADRRGAPERGVRLRH